MTPCLIAGHIGLDPLRLANSNPRRRGTSPQDQVSARERDYAFSGADSRNEGVGQDETRQDDIFLREAERNMRTFENCGHV